jgi:3-deoxy-manno-octulosonate cytidylyltransferase (CMP-KDO synthetase)
MAGGRVLGVIPARIGSRRFPRKVLAPVCGRPLIQHVHERLSEADTVDDVLVATDSAEVADAVRRFGGDAVLIDAACACGSDRVAEAARGRPAEVVVNLQGDQALIDPRDVDAAVGALLDDSSMDIATIAFPSDDAVDFRSRDVVKVVADETGRALYFSREPIPHAGAAAPGNPLFLHHVGIYCFRRRALERFAAAPAGRLEKRESLEQLRALEAGMKVGLLVTDRETPAVDRPEDVLVVERLLKSRS